MDFKAVLKLMWKSAPRSFGAIRLSGFVYEEGEGMSMKTPVTQVERIWRIIGSLAVVLTVAYFAVLWFAIDHQQTGIRLFNQGKDQEAGDHFRIDLRIRPENGPSHFFLGMTLYHQKHYEKAIRELRSAISYQPEYTYARIELANALYATGKRKEARDIWSDILGSPNTRDQYGNQARDELASHPG